MMVESMTDSSSVVMEDNRKYENANLLEENKELKDIINVVLENDPFEEWTDYVSNVTLLCLKNEKGK